MKQNYVFLNLPSSGQTIYLKITDSAGIREMLLEGWGIVTTGPDQHISNSNLHDPKSRHEFTSTLIRNIAELPGRTSPEDDPGAMVANADEIADCVGRAFEEIDTLQSELPTLSGLVQPPVSLAPKLNVKICNCGGSATSGHAPSCPLCVKAFKPDNYQFSLTPPEPDAVINGTELSMQEILTLRASVQDFTLTMTDPGVLGDDEHGEFMRKTYLKNLNAITRYMHAD